MLYKIIFLNVIFITNTLYAFPLTLVSSSSKTYYEPLIYDKPIPYTNPITYILFITHIINQKKNIPKDITQQIINYSILLKKRDFDENFSYKNKWQDFRIPISYRYTLKPKHLNLLYNVFKYKPEEKFILDRYTLCYYLKSKKDYKLFLQLPAEIRKCLSKLPQSAPGDWRNILNLEEKRNINRNKEIYILTSQGYAEKKPILPEEKKKIIHTISFHGSL